MSALTLYICSVCLLIPACIQSICLPSPGAQIPYSFSSPINIKTSETTSVNTTTPFTAVNGVFNLLTVKNTQNSIEVIANADGNSYITGGVLCNKRYKYARSRFYITQNPRGRSGNTINGFGTPLEVENLYYSDKYSTFNEASMKLGATVIISNQVHVDRRPNPFFVPFQQILKSGALKKFGSSIELFAFLLFPWSDALSPKVTYYAYQGAYTSLGTGKISPGAIFIVPESSLGISFSQFEAFKNVISSNGHPIYAAPALKPRYGRPVFKLSGSKQKFTFF